MDECCRCQSYTKKYLMMQAVGIDIDNPPNSDKPYYRRLVQLYENYIPLHLQKKVRQTRDDYKPARLIDKHDIKTDDVYEEDNKTALLKGVDHAQTPLTNISLMDDDDDVSARPICPNVLLLGLDEVHNRATGIAEPHNTSVYTPA
eukprot:9384_1